MWNRSCRRRRLSSRRFPFSAESPRASAPHRPHGHDTVALDTPGIWRVSQRALPFTHATYTRTMSGPWSGRHAPWARLTTVGLATMLAASVLAPPATGSTEVDPDDAAAVGDMPATVDGATGEGQPAQTTVLAAEIDAGPTGTDAAEAASTIEETVEAVGGQVRVDDRRTGLISVEVPEKAAAQVEAALVELPEVDEVATPALFETFRLPRDRQIGRQRDYLRQISVPAAWNRTRGSSKVTVAVVDTGVQARHPDLRGKVAGRYNAAYGTRAVADRDGHGTAVSSIVAANTNNRTGIAGVGWKTRVLAVKAADRSGRLWGDAVADGIRWAVRNGADVVNLSLGSRVDDPWVRAAVRFAQRRDVLVVAAVSNAGSTDPVYPAAYPGVLGVGATEGNGLASFSDRGGQVDVSAPGLRLRAAVPGGYATVNGTSFAAALVSGQAALIMAARPGTKADRVARVIERSGRDVGSGDSATTKIDVHASVLRAEGVWSRPQGLTVRPRARAAVVRWRPPAAVGRGPIITYGVRLKTPGGAWKKAASVSGSVSRATVRSLRPDRRYAVRVVAVNKRGSGPPTTASFRTRG